MADAIVSVSEFEAKAARMLADRKSQRPRNALLLLRLMAPGEADVSAGGTAP